MKGDKINGWLFVSPAILILLVFTIFATGFTIFLSFNKVNLFTGEYTFVGLENFSRMLSDPKLVKAFQNAATFAIVVVPIQTFLSIIIATILSSKIKFQKKFRMIFFLPALTSSAALTLIFMFIFSVQGPINSFLIDLNLINGPINFLNDPDFALKVIMAMNIWSTIPIFITIYLAALTDVPKTVYEAADIDGAGPLKKFFSITIPQLRNVTSYVILVGFIGTLQMFDQAFIFSNGSGGPENSTLTPALLIYNNAFGTQNSMGYAAAISILLSAFILIIAVISNKVTRANKGVDE